MSESTQSPPVAAPPRRWPRELLLAGLCLAGVGYVVAAALPDRGERFPEIESAAPGSESAAIAAAAAAVDRQLARGHDAWWVVSWEPTPRATDLAIARRLSLALVGVTPSLEEIRRFESWPAERRIELWLAHLVRDRRHAHYWAERLARAYVGVDDGPFLLFRRRRFVIWLSEQLHENRPYDELVRELVTAEGIWTDSPAVNFLTATMTQNDSPKRPDPVKLAGRTARAFLGVRLDCVQCHDDFLGGDWRQQDFHGLAAYYSGAAASLAGIHNDPRPYYFRFHGQEPPPLPDILQPDAERPSPREITDDDLTQVLDYLLGQAFGPPPIEPRPPFAPSLLGGEHGVGGDSATRRERLAAWVTHRENGAFRRAIANRVWALMFGRPLLEPIDDLPLDEASVPAGDLPAWRALNALAEDFAHHGYDLRRLIRVIAATEAFQRSSRDMRPGRVVTQHHERAWAAFPLVRLRPEQVVGSLIQSCSLKTIDADSHIFVYLARYQLQNEFLKRYGDVGEDEFSLRGGTVAQRLLMMNGRLVKERTKSNLVANAATNVAVLSPDNSTAVRTAYLTVLTRRPTPAEEEYFCDRLAGTKGPERINRLEDLYWTLLNTTEFAWNH